MPGCETSTRHCSAGTAAKERTMKRHRICVVVFIALSWLSGPYLWAAPLYDLVDLGLFLTMTAINRHGTMTGSTWQYTEHLMMARGTDVTDLGGLGGAYAIGSAIAPGGTIVGFGESVAAGLHTRAFMWTAATGILQELPVTELTLNSSAWGVNDAGVIVGGEAISEAPGSPVIAQSLPVRWVNGAVEI